MDNLQAHKGTAVRLAIEAVVTALRFLPPYSLDLNSIENGFSKLKAMLRKAAPRTVDHLWEAIARIIQTYSPQERSYYFAAAGCNAD